MIVGDGQNRLLLAESYKAPGSGVGYPPPADAGGKDQSESDFLMMSGLVGLMPPDLAMFLDPEWLPALPELPGKAE